MPQLVAFSLLVSILYIGDVLSTRTKSWLPGFVLPSYLLGYWTFFPADIVAIAGFQTPIVIWRSSCLSPIWARCCRCANCGPMENGCGVALGDCGHRRTAFHRGFVGAGLGNRRCWCTTAGGRGGILVDHVTSCGRGRADQPFGAGDPDLCHAGVRRLPAHGHHAEARRKPCCVATAPVTGRGRRINRRSRHQ